MWQVIVFLIAMQNTESNIIFQSKRFTLWIRLSVVAVKLNDLYNGQAVKENIPLIPYIKRKDIKTHSVCLAWRKLTQSYEDLQLQMREERNVESFLHHGVFGDPRLQ